MRRFAPFAAFIVVALVPCIFSQPHENQVPDVNPEVAKEARGLCEEIWPGLEDVGTPYLAQLYANRLQTLEEVAHRAKELAKTRLAKELQPKLSGENPKFPRDEIIAKVEAEFDETSVEDIMLASNIIINIDQNPQFTDQMVQDGAIALMSAIGYNVGRVSRDFVLDMLRPQIIATFLLFLVIPNSGVILVSIGHTPHGGWEKIHAIDHSQ